MTLVSNLQKTSFTSVWYFKHYFFVLSPILLIIPYVSYRFQTQVIGPN